MPKARPRRARKSGQALPLKPLASALNEYGNKLTHAMGRLANREWSQVKAIATGVGDELVSILISLNLYPLGLVNLDRLEFISSVVPLRPVLLVHGYIHNNSVFYIMKRRLLREGWKHVYTINLKTHAKGIDECAVDISKKVDQICKETGAEKVDLIAHSFGGLCARYFVQAIDGGAAKVSRCITLGTPHQGTQLAYLGFGPANWDMQPGSDLIELLNNELPLPEAVEFTNIWSPFDYMVIPIENAIMEGRVRNIQLDYLGHLGMLFSRKVFDYVFLALSSDSIHRSVPPRRKAAHESKPRLEAKRGLSFLRRS